MVWEIEKEADVLIDEAEGHSLPPVLAGGEMPIRGVVVEPATMPGAEDLWLVRLNAPFGGTEEYVVVQVHADQLSPGDGSCKECRSEKGRHHIHCKLARSERERLNGKEPAAYWTTNQMIASLFHHTAGKHGGSFGIRVQLEGDFSVMAEYGSEAEDSPMAGAATYGMAGTLRGALMRAGADAGIWVYDDSPDPGERQQRILIVEAKHPAEMNADAVQGSMSLLADADEAYVFFGDKGATLKHRDFASEDVAVAIQRRPEQSHEQVPAKARADVIRQIRDLAPHEVKCTCSHGGDFDMTVHSEFCARRQLAHVLATVEEK